MLATSTGPVWLKSRSISIRPLDISYIVKIGLYLPPICFLSDSKVSSRSSSGSLPTLGSYPAGYIFHRRHADLDTIEFAILGSIMCFFFILVVWFVWSVIVEQQLRREREENEERELGLELQVTSASSHQVDERVEAAVLGGPFGQISEKV